MTCPDNGERAPTVPTSSPAAQEGVGEEGFGDEVPPSRVGFQMSDVSKIAADDAQVTRSVGDELDLPTRFAERF